MVFKTFVHASYEIWRNEESMNVLGVCDRVVNALCWMCGMVTPNCLGLMGWLHIPLSLYFDWGLFFWTHHKISWHPFVMCTAVACSSGVWYCGGCWQSCKYLVLSITIIFALGFIAWIFSLYITVSFLVICVRSQL